MREGRIFDSGSTHYNHRKVVAQPKLMGPNELQQGYYWLLRHLNSLSSIAKTVQANIDPKQSVSNPTLAVIQSGLPWGIETYLTVLELSARGYMDRSIQQELDSNYNAWKNRGH